MSIWRLVAVAGAWCVVYATPMAAAQSPPVNWHSISVRLSDGREVSVDSSAIEVAENRAGPGSRRLRLSIFRIPASTSSDEIPLFYLEGAPDTGPVSRNMRIAGLMDFFRALSARRDVILMDYRGTGASSGIGCPPYAESPADLFESRATALSFYMAQAQACSVALRTAGVDLDGYTWNEVAADVNDVRAALGYPKIHLLGFSSGTHAALLTASRYPTTISRLVMVGTEAPSQTRKLPLAGDRQLARIAAATRPPAAMGSASDLVAIVTEVLERAERRPFEIAIQSIAGDTIRMKVGRYALANLATRNMSGPGEFRTLIQLFSSLDGDDTTVLTAVIQRLARRPSVLDAPTFLMDGAAGISEGRSRRLEEEAGTSLFGNASSFPYPEIGRAWGNRQYSGEYSTGAASELPVLFITGELDGNTPPEQASEIAREFTRSTEIVVGNAGHSDPMQMISVAEVIDDFLGEVDVSGRRLSTDPAEYPVY